jgi:RecA/RadA recombinase
MGFRSKLQKDADKLMAGERPSFVVSTDSPGCNYLFGKRGGLEAGTSMLLYGPPKAGKSLLAYDFCGKFLRDNPHGDVLYFDTEYRDGINKWQDAFQIDRERFIHRKTNNPTEIFDYIAKDLQALLQENEKFKPMIVIDSLAQILYPKEANKESSDKFVIGDAGAYLPGAMKMITPVIRKYKIPLILCQHVRANMDPNTAKYKPYIIPGGWGLKHNVESWVLVEKINAKDSKSFNEGVQDGAGNNIQTGHMIRVKMEENSNGPQNRAVEVNIDYVKGIVDTHVEIAELAKNMGLVERPNDRTYILGDKKWVGFDNFCNAIKSDVELQKSLIQQISEKDMT